MAFDYAKLVRESFEHLGPRNPLKKLSDSHRRLLVALLDIHVRVPELVYDEFFSSLEEAGSIAAEAGALGRRIKSQMIGARLPQILTPLLQSIEDIPARLEDFSERMATLVDKMWGKRGHKGKMQKNQFLIMASEFVRAETGKHYDEHLAELLQAVNADIDPNGKADISGDSIRKKREHLMKTYPHIYLKVVNQLLSFRSLSIAKG